MPILFMVGYQKFRYLVNSLSEYAMLMQNNSQQPKIVYSCGKFECKSFEKQHFITHDCSVPTETQE